MRSNFEYKLILSLLLWVSTLAIGQRHYKVQSVSELNTAFSSEIGFTITSEGFVFASNRKSNVFTTHKDQYSRSFYSLYEVNKKGDNLTSPKIMARDLIGNDHMSMPTISNDGNTMYFTRAYSVSTNAEGEVQYVNGIFVCYKRNNEWVDAEPFEFNNDEYDVSFPYLTLNGTVLYFASKDPAGFGGYDLYVTRKQGRKWAEPENLGATINTSENEVTPFYHSSGKLYFASRGHNSTGGLDIFFTEKIGGKWITPLPLSRRFNTRSDDFGYIADHEMDTGYFISKRDGTDDIFRFISTFPNFPECEPQEEDNFCYLFEEEGTINLDTTSFRYEWDFGDGTKVRKEKAKHCFENPGLYMVQLNVIDTLTGEIQTSQATYPMEVERIEQPYIISPDTAAVGERISFDGTQSSIRSFAIEGYYWDMGDGAFKQKEQITHTYTKQGKYYIKLGLTGTTTYNESAKKCAIKEIIIVRNRN